MDYRGRYVMFDASRVRTYAVAGRANKVTLADLVDPATVSAGTYDVGDQAGAIGELAESMVSAVWSGKPVIWLTGAHLIKNGLGPLVIDLVARGAVSLVAANAAVTIHDFELALIGQTSEHVPNALPDGQFGMARELGYINAAVAEGNAYRLGYGESLGRLICDDDFRLAVQKRLGLTKAIAFKHIDTSVIAACYQRAVPLTVHAGIGTDVIDQHPNFDGQAKGGCSGRDFLIYTEQVARLAGGGVVLNVGSAVTGPEVLLKAVSMAGNVGRPPRGLVTADFDLKPYRRSAMTDEGDFNYYFRHHKSVATRVPEAFGGKGFYVQGDQRVTIPRLYQEVVRALEARR